MGRAHVVTPTPQSMQRCLGCLGEAMVNCIVHDANNMKVEVPSRREAACERACWGP